MPESKQAPKEKEEKAPTEESVPNDIKPLFVATQGQQIFGCVADEDVTSDNPYKLIPKEQILQDFLNRAGVSDFKEAKSVINNYPGEELLLVYDYEFKYGQNFYLCLTEEAKERILHPPKDDGEEEGEGTEGKEAEEEQVEIPVTPEPKEWISQQSDVEIKDAVVENSRPLLKFVVTRKRQLFGAPFQFADCLASSSRDMYIDIASQDIHDDDDTQDIQRMEMEVSIQAVPELVDACCQTEWKKPVNAAVQYEAQVMSEEEATTIMESDSMVNFFNSTCPRVELSLQQNEIMDVFVDDYRALSDTDGIVADKSDSSLKEYQSFTDLKFSKDKPITWIDWHPVQKGIVAVSCVQNYECDERIDLYSKLLLEHSLILIWSFVDPIHPQLFLEAPDDVTCFQYNPTNPSIIAGGCMNGQIVIWDISAYEEQFMSNKGPSLSDNKGPAANLAVFDTDPKLDHAPIVRHVALSSIEFGHKKTISAIQWIPSHIEICSKTFQIYSNTTQMCNQLITCSIDGSVMIWDTRPMKPTGGAMVLQQVDPVTSFQHLDLVWKPFLKVSFPRSDNPGDFAATRVSIQERHPVFTNKLIASSDKASVDIPRELLEGKTTQFYIGTEDGEIVYCDWKPVKDQESGKLTAPRPDHYFTVHSGAITCLERSPFFKDIILSVGGWTFAIWKEAIKSDALLKSASSVVLLTGGTWSPTRPGVFFIIKANGNLEVWDLMDRSHVPYLAQNVSPLSLTTISAFPISNKQLMLGVGDLGGTLHILEVPWSLRHPSSHEMNIMESFFDREVKRLEYVGERRQLRINQKKEIDAALAAKEQESKKVKEVDNWESKAKVEYEEFLNLENALLIELGLREVKQED